MYIYIYTGKLLLLFIPRRGNSPEKARQAFGATHRAAAAGTGCLLQNFVGKAIGKWETHRKNPRKTMEKWETLKKTIGKWRFTPWQFNITMENHNVFMVKRTINGHFPYRCVNLPEV